MARRASGPSKVEVPMTPMIDIVFQLLIFFMLQLKILAPEGNFNVNMPIGAPAPPKPDEIKTPDIKVRMVADAAGNLAQLSIGSRNLGNDDQAFDRLNGAILGIIGRPGNPLTKDVEVEIDADYELHYQYTIRAVSSCTGRMDMQTKRLARYVEKIKFAQPRKPKGA
jgi:biopolymer transport protein ExbD